MKVLLSLLAMVFAASSATAAEYCDSPDPKTLLSIVRIAGNDDSHASGVVIARNGVLTAAHVVEGATEISVRIGGKYKRAKVLSVDPIKDLAMLSVATGDLQPVRLSKHLLDESDLVWAVGYPRAEAQIASSGNLSDVLNGDLHTTAPVDSGQSGGGLIGCANGRHVLAGMLRGYGAVKRGEEYVRLDNYSVSVAASDIWAFLYRNGWVKNPWVASS